MSSPAISEDLVEPGEDVLNELYDTVFEGFRPIGRLTRDLITSMYPQETLTREEFDSSRATHGSVSTMQRTLSCKYQSQFILGFQMTNGLEDTPTPITPSPPIQLTRSTSTHLPNASSSPARRRPLPQPPGSSPRVAASLAPPVTPPQPQPQPPTSPAGLSIP